MLTAAYVKLFTSPGSAATATFILYPRGSPQVPASVPWRDWSLVMNHKTFLDTQCYWWISMDTSKLSNSFSFNENPVFGLLNFSKCVWTEIFLFSVDCIQLVFTALKFGHLKIVYSDELEESEEEKWAGECVRQHVGGVFGQFRFFTFIY